MNTRHPFVLLILLLLLPAPLLGAQETGGEGEETRRLLVFFEMLPGGQLSQREQDLLYETLLIKLSDTTPRIAVKEYEGFSIPPTDSEKNDAAEKVEADSWLQVTVSGNSEAVVIEARSLDMLSGQIAYAVSLEKELRRGIRDLEHQFWDEVITATAEYYETAFSKDITGGTLVFEGLPGTRIRGSAWRRLKIDTSGRVSTGVPLPATLPFRATKPGFFPIEGQIYMDQTSKIVPLEQIPGARLAFDFFLGNMSYPGIQLNYFFVPDAVFGRIGILSYLIGFVLDDADRFDDSNMFVSHTLNNFNLSFGFYFNAPDRYFRPYSALGAVWRFVTASGYWGLEPIAPFALQPLMGCEYGRGGKLKVFAEYSPYFYWAPERYLFALSLPEDRKPSFLFFPFQKDLVDWAVVWEIFVFQVGVRWRL